MKLKKVRIRVETLQETKVRWQKALRGEIRNGRANEEVITVSSWEILGRVLSPARLQILSLIPVLKPKSILELAKSLKKNFKNVHSDVLFLAELGLIELRTSGRSRNRIPTAKYEEIEFSLAA